MDDTEKARELINKHLYLHGGDGLGINDGDVYRAVLDAVCEALTIPAVVGQSEQLGCDNHRADLEHFIKYSESICKNCKKKV